MSAKYRPSGHCGCDPYSIPSLTQYLFLQSMSWVSIYGLGEIPFMHFDLTRPSDEVRYSISGFEEQKPAGRQVFSMPAGYFKKRY